MRSEAEVIEDGNHNKLALGVGLGVALGSGMGISFGAAIGAALGDVARGIVFGLPLGSGLGVVAGVTFATLMQRTAGACPTCGYSLKGLRGTICPECGADIADSDAQPPGSQSA